MLKGDAELYRPKRPKKKHVAIFGLIGLIGLAGVAVLVAIGVFVISAWFGLPAFGFSEGPDQPIPFPHTVHVNEVGLDCTFCHRTVTEDAAASIPAVSLCMSCHQAVGKGLEGVETLRDFSESGRSIEWVRVHRMPDHVQFVHEAHVRAFSGTKRVVEVLRDRQTEIRLDEARKVDDGASAGQTIEVAESQVCVICHGDVASMPKVKQVRPLKMADCVNCHRDNSAPTDCTTCHY